jgi:type II secretory ATPase GspE/PulE/Tfp pilus assembly ATPase PilB-like protein
MSEPQTLSAGKPIDQGELLDALAADGLIDAADARRLRYAPRTREGVARHPVNFVADQQLVSRTSSSSSSSATAATLDANDQHVVHIVDWLLQYAFEQRASDIHIEPRRESGNVRFRIDGVLHQVYQIPTPVMAAMTSRHQDPRPHGRRREAPAAGRPRSRRSRPTGNEVELRLSTMPTAFGEKLVMRIFDPDVLVKDFASWGSPTTTRHALGEDGRRSRTASSS